ncbi:hypothetical protein MJO29_009443, partial [Puccinia striiformis f. sp. tritici]
STEKKRETRKTHKLANTSRSAFNLRTWTVKTVFKFIISTITLLRLLTYVSVFFLNGCPPNSTVFNANGLVNFFQGDWSWWVSPNLTRANQILLQMANACSYHQPHLTFYNPNMSIVPNSIQHFQNLMTIIPLYKTIYRNAKRLGIKRAEGIVLRI